MMGRVILLVCFLFCLSTPAMAIERIQGNFIFSQAVQAYKDGRFDDAARLNEEIISGGLESPAVYYNLGNAYFKEKKLGKAIVNYMRAEILLPRDADLLANLTFARGAVENYRPLVLASGWAGFLTSLRLSSGELKWVALVFFMAAGIFFAAGLYFPERRKMCMLLAGLLVFVWGYFFMACIAKGASEAGLAVAVKAESARFEPLESATSYFKLFEGTEVRLLRTQDGWSKIERPDGKLAWVPSDSLEKVFP